MERNMTYIALFAAVIAALGLLPKLTLATGIPITMQSMGIMLCGTILGAKRGALAVLLFLGLVAMGLPLLPGGRGGLGAFQTPWAGFLFGFPLAAFMAGFVMETTRGLSIRLWAFIAALFGGIVVLYMVAIPYYMIMANATLIDAIIVAGLPFIPGDIIKAVLVCFITSGLYRARPAAVLSRA